MKKKIIIGSLLAVILMLLVPSIPAMEYQNVEYANEEYYINYIREMDEIKFKDLILNQKNNDDEILELLKERIKIPLFLRIIYKIIKIILKLLLLPFKIIFLPIKIILLPFKIICNIIRLPFKIIRCIINIILPGKQFYRIKIRC